MNRRIGSDGEMRDCTQLIILALKREASAGWECQVRERFLFPFNKGHSRVYLNANGNDLVGGEH